MTVLLQTFVFSVSDKNWMKYDWKKITTIGARYTNASLVCYAHSRGVRVVKLGTLMSHIEIFNGSYSGPVAPGFSHRYSYKNKSTHFYITRSD